jgi:trimethylamine--corrinoid protein Co-methyltransferase
MSTAISVYGAPEFQLARSAVASMGRFYELPTWGYAGHTDSIVMDEQAASDATFSVLVALLSGANLVHDVGYMEAGLMCSPEMIVFTDEIIGMLRHFSRGIVFGQEDLALDTIRKVGAGGNYLTEDHTLAHFQELWIPTLFERRRFEGWKADGAKGMRERLKEKTLDLMRSKKSEVLPSNVREEIRRLLRSG